MSPTPRESSSDEESFQIPKSRRRHQRRLKRAMVESSSSDEDEGANRLGDPVFEDVDVPTSTADWVEGAGPPNASLKFESKKGLPKNSVIAHPSKRRYISCQTLFFTLWSALMLA